MSLTNSVSNQHTHTRTLMSGTGCSWDTNTVYIQVSHLLSLRVLLRWLMERCSVLVHTQSFEEGQMFSGGLNVCADPI